MSYNLVDPFYGNTTVDLPIPQGIAATWDWRKAETGNTHPGATLPFGMVSALAYSGAYPTGYGVNDVSTIGPPRRLFEKKTALGFTHFQQAGGGYIGDFYNYVMITPLTSWDQRGSRFSLVAESARPGYYGATLEETGIRCELAAAQKGIVHRYTFADRGPAYIAVDLATGGLLLNDYPMARVYPSIVDVQRTPGGLAGHLEFRGFPLYFALSTPLRGASGFWDGDVIIGGERLRRTDYGMTTGLWLTAEEVTGPVEVKIAFSFRSVEQAEQNLSSLGSFDATAAAARATWEKQLDRIEIEGVSDAQAEIFYSCLYHALRKPTLCTDESPYWLESPFILDLATLWDMYKTQIPLVHALCPEMGAALANAMLLMAEYHGGVASFYTMNRDSVGFNGQGQGLGVYALADGFFRDVPGVDWQAALDAGEKTLRLPNAQPYLDEGRVLPITHTLDLSGAWYALAVMAERLGDRRAAQFMANADNWRNAYDPETAMLPVEGTYYEGTNWNYSFRPQPFMAERIAMFADTKAFVGALDTFFGYHDEIPAAAEYQRAVHDNRFEGINNEPDMEVPYSYLWAGRHDRVAEVVRAVMKWQYATGPGGLPGNDDTGGLTSWYVWNAIGLFPLTGRDFYAIGSPLVGRARIAFGKGEFEVITENNSDENIYVQRARLNGESLGRAWLSIDEVERGGTLTLEMGNAPATWASEPMPV